jgi:hypothetical protein
MTRKTTIKGITGETSRATVLARVVLMGIGREGVISGVEEEIGMFVIEAMYLGDQSWSEGCCVWFSFRV